MKPIAALLSVVLILAATCSIHAQAPVPVGPAGPVTRDQATATAAPPASQPAAEAVNPEGVKQAEQILHMVHKTYRTAQAMTDSLKVEYKSGMGNNTAEELKFAFDNIGGETMDVPGMKFIAYGEKFYIVRNDVADKYFASDAKNISTGLESAFGENNRVPPPVAFHDLSDRDGQLQSMTMGLINSPHLVNLETIKTESGQSMHEIRFAGEGGSGKAHVTVDSNLLKKVMLNVKPVGAPEGVSIQVTLTLDPKVLDRLPQPIIFDPGARKAVKSMHELEPTPLAIGEVAPDFTLSTLSGESVTLSTLKGSVVVLDFWATWCGPCKRALPELQKFSEWAAASGKPVKVFAVDVWEREQTVDAKVEKVKKFWTGAGYTMHTLMDTKDEVAKLYGVQSIPTTLIIDPNGKLFKLHSGFAPGMMQMLQTEVEEALNAQ